MELFDQIRKISFLFFVAAGLAHFTSGFFAINGYLMPHALTVNRVLFIPFVVAALTYCFSHIKCRLLEEGNTSKTWDYISFGFGIAVFLALLSIELLVIDAPNPLATSH